MSSLSNKRILLGVTGGIAAYKSAELLRRLISAGADVRVVMTESAQAFITPLTMQALSGNPVHTDLVSLEAEAAMGHIELARWADLVLVAPCTANFMAKLVAGDADDLLTTLYLASNATKVIAPAMNQAMWAAEATQQNLILLKDRAVNIVGPASGQQACGDVGLGRMEEPDFIAEFCANLFSTGSLAGKRVLITAGPTREAIDPVRYISNHSSGKMGYALAEAAAEAGAKVTLVSGPVNLACPDRVKRVDVISARDMYQEVMELGDSIDIFIGSAAVADYRPAEVAEQKIKKQHATNGISEIALVENPDIIKAFAETFAQAFVVGFAAETNDVENYAKSKLERKNLNMIVANDVSDSRIGFNSADNAVLVITREGQQALGLQNKSSLARQLIAIVAEEQCKGES